METFGAKHLIGLGAAILLLAGLVAIYISARKRMLAQTKQLGPAFTLEQLRQMHQERQISEKEYKSLKEKMIRENQ